MRRVRAEKGVVKTMSASYTAGSNRRRLQRIGIAAPPSLGHDVAGRAGASLMVFRSADPQTFPF